MFREITDQKLDMILQLSSAKLGKHTESLCHGAKKKNKVLVCSFLDAGISALELNVWAN